MLISKDLLFIHIPKTGGTSVQHVLQRHLDGPVLSNFNAGVEHKHQMLKDIPAVVEPYGFDIKKVRKILAMYRNPYAIEVSFYFHFRQHQYSPIGEHLEDEAYRAAKEEDFSGFVKRNDWPPLSLYTKTNDPLLQDKIIILRLESPSLANELRQIFVELGLGDRNDRWQLPHMNSTDHQKFGSYYTGETEEIVYYRYRDTFDAGWYRRGEGLDF